VYRGKYARACRWSGGSWINDARFRQIPPIGAAFHPTAEVLIFVTIEGQA
jgi:hypothetical protein